jgi:hypothetical protein
MKGKNLKINFNFRKIITLLAEKSFLSSVVLILLAFLLGAYLFYNYYYSALEYNPPADGGSLRIEEGAYQEVVSRWQSRQGEYEGADYKNYINPFWSSGAATGTEGVAD